MKLDEIKKIAEKMGLAVRLKERLTIEEMDVCDCGKLYKPWDYKCSKECGDKSMKIYEERIRLAIDKRIQDKKNGNPHMYGCRCLACDSGTS